MKKDIYFYSIFVILCLSVASCNARTPFKTPLKFLLSESSCEPPCWLGMTPGVTDVETAREQLAASGNLIDQESIFDYVPTEAYPIKIGWQADNSEISGTLSFKTELLDHVYIRANEGKMLLSDGIQLYGIPEKVIFELVQCKVNFGDSLCLRVYLHYPQKGLQLSYEQGESDYEKLIIDPNQQIDLIHFFDPEIGPYSNEMDVPEAGHTLNWPGYNEINIRLVN